MNIANKITIVRILLIPFFIAFTLYGKWEAALVIFIIAAVSDGIDGYIARATKQRTELGKILDPLADTLLILSLVIAFIITSGFPIWLAVSIFLRDFGIMLASYLLYKKYHLVKPSIIIGKITFGGISTLLLFFVIAIPLVFGFLLWSFGEYFNIYKEIKNG